MRTLYCVGIVVPNFFPVCLDFFVITQFLPIWSDLTHLSIWVLEVLFCVCECACGCVNLVLECLCLGELFLISALYGFVIALLRCILCT